MRGQTFRRALRMALAFSALVGGQQPDNSGERYTLSGKVVNSLSGQPVPRALVSLTGNAPQSGLTEAGGEFRFTGLPGGAYSVTAQKPGFRMKSQSQNGIIKLGPSREVSVPLEPLASVHGRIVDDDGEPWPGVQVEVLAVSIDNGRRQTRRYVAGLTDDRGQYRVYGLQPELYYIRAAGRAGQSRLYVGETGTAGASDESFETAYYGGGSGLSGATPVRLAAGQDLAADMALTIRPGYAVRGFVSNLTQYAAATVELLRGGELIPSGNVSVNTVSGRFQARGLVDGTYTIRVRQGAGDQETRAEQTVQVAGANVDNVLLELARAIQVPVNLTAERSEALHPNLGRAYTLSLIPLDAIDADAWSRRFTPELGFRQDDGPKTLAVFPGRYRVAVMHMGGYVASLACGQADLRREEWVVPQGGPACTLEVAVRRDGGQVEATVPSGLGRAVLIPEDGGAPLPGWVRGGNVTFRMVPPGEYRAWAWAGDQEIEYMNPEVLRKSAISGDVFRVDPNGKHAIRLGKDAR